MKAIIVSSLLFFITQAAPANQETPETSVDTCLKEIAAVFKSEFPEGRSVIHVNLANSVLTS